MSRPKIVMSACAALFVVTGLIPLGSAAIGAPSTVVRAAATASPCTSKMVFARGYWTFMFPTKGTVGGRVSATGHLKVWDIEKTPCVLTTEWPRLHLLVKSGGALKVHPRLVNGSNTYPPPITLAPHGATKFLLTFQWINWCGGLPHAPIQIAYTVGPQKHMRAKHIILGLGKGFKRFHAPGCVNPTAKSVMNVQPYQPAPVDISYNH